MRKWEAQIFKLADKFQDRIDQFNKEDQSWYESMFQESEESEDGEAKQYPDEDIDPLPNYNRRFMPPQPSNYIAPTRLRAITTPVPTPKIETIIEPRVEQSIEHPSIKEQLIPQKPQPQPQPTRSKATPKVTNKQVEKLQRQIIMVDLATKLEQQIAATKLSPAENKHLKFLAYHIKDAAKKSNFDTYAIVSGLKDYMYVSKKVPVILDIIQFLS